MNYIAGEKKERNEEIIKRILSGEENAALAKHFNISRQRIDQIAKRYIIPKRTEADLFFKNLSFGNNGCWNWSGTKNRRYGIFRGTLAHRWIYEHSIGEIPNGYHVDHLCYNTVCVNPAHLEAVTPVENTRRSVEHYKSLGVFYKDFCKNGHSIKEKGSYYTTHIGLDGAQRKRCKKCQKIAMKKSIEKKRKLSYKQHALDAQTIIC